MVHSEHIPYRLSDTANLSYGQALYVLSEALAGFQELHYRFGPFQITDDHIGFNEIGQAKVWHNPNFASNHFDRESILLMSTTNPKNFDERMEIKQEQEMVEDIWLAVSQHANISPEFANRVNSLKGIDFNGARNLVNEEILRGTAYVPEFLNFSGLRATKSSIQGNFLPPYLQQNSISNTNSNSNPFQSNVQQFPLPSTSQSFPQQYTQYGQQGVTVGYNDGRY